MLLKNKRHYKKYLLLSKSTWIHLRIPYSLCLSPVFFFACSELNSNDNHGKLFLIFIILHLFLYPASQAYNSYYDNDSQSIGGIEKPPKITREVLLTSYFFDFLAISLSLFFIGHLFFMAILTCSLLSKAYSHPKIRLKKRPLLSWLTVSIFQGPFIYLAIFLSFSPSWTIALKQQLAAALSTAFLFGGAYPMTQIFQHKEDQERGDETLSLKLGIKGTFIFSAINFLIGVLLLFYYQFNNQNFQTFYIFPLFMLPTLIYFSYWFYLCLKNELEANFINCMRLNIISTLCFSSFFIFV
ncbi:MAG: ubiquinone biosynthesis protein UbiA [Halobacteriovoraceae bacterium]|nr:ubiquinone biosynthesis protein UbiA [Halobacteriovoraceae bacterium]